MTGTLHSGLPFYISGLPFLPFKGKESRIVQQPLSPYRCTQKLPPSGHFSRLAAGPQLFPVLIKTKMITLPSLPTVISPKFPAH